MNFLDFSIQARRTAGNRLLVEVLDSPVGSARGEVKGEVDMDRLHREFEFLALGTDRDRRRHLVGVPPPGAASSGGGAGSADLGAELFEALFPSEVRSCFDESLGAARADGARGLRIKIRQEPEERDERRFASLPWELLYRRHQRRFLGLDRRTPIVRYLEVSQPADPLPMPYPLRIAVVQSAPRDTPRLDLEREFDLLERAWSDLYGVEITTVEPSPRGLRSAVVDHGCHVLHFMGHGNRSRGGAGSLVLEAPGRRSHEVDGESLRALLQGNDELRLVVLNACWSAYAPVDPQIDPFSAVAYSLVLGGVPAVVAMSLPVADASAIEFGAAFYRQLKCGEPVDVAATEGRVALSSVDSSPGAWGVPRVLCRVPDVVLFRGGTDRQPTGDARRAFDRGMERWRRGDPARARDDFEEATRLTEAYAEADLYSCLASLAIRPPAALDRSEAQRLNGRLGRLLETDREDLAVLAARALAILRHEFFRQKRLKAQGISTDELARWLRGKPPTRQEVEALSAIQFTAGAALAAGLLPRGRRPASS